MTKYHAKKAHADGICFDSHKEMRRYLQLKQMQKDGEIENLELQKKYLLIPAQRAEGYTTKQGRYKPGHVIEKACSYVCDFTYIQDGELVVEDVKGYKTPEYKLKRKLMLFVHGIAIKEVAFRIEFGMKDDG